MVNFLVDTMPDGWRHWRDFEAILDEAGKNKFASVAEALDEDQGRYLGFIRLVGNRKEGSTPANLYDPGLIASLSNDAG